MYLAFCSGGLAGRRVAVHPGTTRIGRSAASDLRLPEADGTASGTHATLEGDGARWQLVDDGSTTGTFVNGKRLKASKPMPIAAGDWVMFGASGATALLQSVDGRPLASWLVLESAVHPGRFVAGADTARMRVSVDTEGTPTIDGAPSRPSVRVRLDRHPPFALAPGQDADDGTPVSIDTPLSIDGTDVRVLGIRSKATTKAAAAKPKQGIGQRTLLRAVRASSGKSRNLMFALVGVTILSLGTAGYLVVDALNRARDEDRARIAGVSDEVDRVSEDVAGVSTEVSQVSNEVAGVSERVEGVSEEMAGVTETVQRTAEDVAREKTERANLARRMEAMRRGLAKTFDKQRTELETALRKQQAAAKAARASAGKNERERFAALFQRYRGSVYLLYVEVAFPDLVDAGGFPLSMATWGTGWAASADGLIVTNKHVVQPHKFDAQVQQILGQHPGARVKTSIYAYPSGARFLDAAGYPPNRHGGFSTARGNLRLVKTATDTWTTRQVADRNGRTARVRVHAHSDADLAVLRATGQRLRPLPLLANPRSVEPLAPVMLLGFPLGAAILDTGRADLSTSLGTVRFVREVVNHTAPAFPGNSGGPLLTIDGNVLGVLTRTQRGYETMTMAIRADRVVALLRSVR